MSENELKDLEGKVLVPKVGQEDLFYEALGSANKIATSSLGWRGMAEMFHKLGPKELGFNMPKDLTNEQQIDTIEQYLKDIYLRTINEHGEWLTEEEALKRKQSTEILYGHKPKE